MHGCNDLADVVNESHVEHAVGFVENEALNSAEVELPLAHQIEKTTRGGNDNVDTSVHGGDLGPLADAAVNDRAAQREVPAVSAKLFAGLDCQFTGRRQDEGTRAAALSDR